jgi:O-antigen/teichoic acid export membrane protein
MKAQTPHMVRSGSVARNTTLNLLGQVLPLLVGVATIPRIIRGLGTDGYGILSIAWMLLGYFGIFDLGLSRAVTKFVASHLDPSEIHKVPAIVWTSLLLQFAMGTFGGLVGASVVPYAVTHLFTMPPAYTHDAEVALFLLCAGLPVILVGNGLRGVLEAAQRFDLVNSVKVPASISFYVVAAVAVALGIHVPGVVLLSVISRVLTLVAYLIMCLRVFPELRQQLVVSRNIVRPLAAYGGWVTVSNVATPIFGYLERFFIATFLSVSMLSYYSAPFELVSKTIIFPASITSALFPVFSYQGNKQSTLVREMTSRAVKYLLFIMTPLIAVFVFFPREILTLWLSAKFANEGSVVMQFLAISLFLNAFAYLPFTSVQALGRPDLKALLDAIALPAYALYGWFLTRHYGINGAAFAKLISAAIDCVCLFWFAWRLRAFSIRDFASGPLFRSLLASIGMIAGVSLVSHLHLKLPLAGVALSLCCACYAGVCWLLAIDSYDKTSIYNLSRRLFARA